MKFVSATLLLLSSLNVGSSKSTTLLESTNGLNQHQLLTAQFESWVDFHSKKYASTSEAKKRFAIWAHNHALIEQHNNKNPPSSYSLGHNAFSDLTLDEFHQLHNLGKHQHVAESAMHFDTMDPQLAADVARELRDLTLPDYVNWIELGGVTPVKNQGACGACWAFSTTGALEGAKYIKTGELTGLSEQNLLDCDHTDLGCSGGLMDNAFKFDEKSGGLCSEADYPYIAARNDECKTDCTDVPGSIVKTFVDVPPGSERALLLAIAMQPISIAIQADQFAFQFYRRGILDDDSCGKEANIDHGVLAVGYGTDLETQTPYWMVKNSWGETWGDEGYVKIARNSTNEFGMCAILKLASFPVVE